MSDSPLSWAWHLMGAACYDTRLTRASRAVLHALLDAYLYNRVTRPDEIAFSLRMPRVAFDSEVHTLTRLGYLGPARQANA